MRALQVSIDGRVVGAFASRDQGPLLAIIGNIPRAYMRAHIMTETATESWQWQLPDVQDGECIEFYITETEPESVCPPQFVRRLEAEGIDDAESINNNEGRCENEGT